jgi:hypothetical protein
MKRKDRDMNIGIIGAGVVGIGRGVSASSMDDALAGDIVLLTTISAAA